LRLIKPKGKEFLKENW